MALVNALSSLSISAPKAAGLGFKKAVSAFVAPPARVGAGRPAVFAVEAKQNKKARTILVRRRASPPLRRPAPRVRSNRTNPRRARDPDARARLSRRRDRTPRGRVRPPARVDDARAAAAIAKTLSAGAFFLERAPRDFVLVPPLARGTLPSNARVGAR
jgi:hypothetical protein